MPVRLAVRLLLAAAAVATPPIARASDSPRPASTLDLERLDAAVRAFLERESVGAAHVSVLQGGQLVFERGYGSVPGGAPPTSRSVFPIGSLSKQFTAATILALADAGRLRLDAPARDFLPEWFADEPGLHLTHLLTHTSGLADFLWLPGYRPLGDDAASPKAAFLALGARAPRKFAPGERWSYSNTNYKALALIAERVTGRPFGDVLSEHVLRPAGLGDVQACHALAPEAYVPGFAPGGRPAPLDPSRAAYEGDGGLCASAANLVAWLRHGLGARGLLARLAVPARLNSGQEVPYGFGISTREFLGHAMVWHAGNVDGHSTLVAHAPRDDRSIVVLTNKGFAWLTELLPAWIGEPAPTAAPAAPAKPPEGRYEDGLFRLELRAEGAELHVEIDLIGPIRFAPAGPHEYVARDLPATFRIRLPADGSRDAFEFDWGEVRSFARRVPDEPPGSRPHLR